jgi:hypothetical protein
MLGVQMKLAMGEAFMEEGSSSTHFFFVIEGSPYHLCACTQLLPITASFPRHATKQKEGKPHTLLAPAGRIPFLRFNSKPPAAGAPGERAGECPDKCPVAHPPALFRHTMVDSVWLLSPTVHTSFSIAQLCSSLPNRRRRQ